LLELARSAARAAPRSVCLTVGERSVRHPSAALTPAGQRDLLHDLRKLRLSLSVHAQVSQRPLRRLEQASLSLFERRARRDQCGFSLDDGASSRLYLRDALGKDVGVQARKAQSIGFCRENLGNLANGGE